MTFARLAKLLAVLLVAVALWRAKPPASPTRVAVLALPGATIELLAPQSVRPADGVPAPPVSTSGVAFWRRLFAFGSGNEGEEFVALWSGSQGPVRALAVPARLLDPQQEAASIREAFAGSSAGAIVEAADVTSGRLPSPYDRAVDTISAEAARLGREQWSDWITVEPVPVSANPVQQSPVVQFQFARIGEASYFFSPAYSVERLAGSAAPFLLGLEREYQPVVAAHAIALAQKRLQALRPAFAPSPDLRAVVVFDSVAEQTSDVFAPDSTPAAVQEQTKDAIESELAVLRGAMGAHGLVLVVGGPSMVRKTTAQPWYAILEGGDQPGEIRPSTLSLDVGRAMVRYLAGVSLDAREKSLVPAAVTNRVQIRPTIAAPPAAATPKAPDMEWSAATLESVPGAVTGAH